MNPRPGQITPGALVVAGDEDTAAVCQIVDLAPAGDGTIVHVRLLPGSAGDCRQLVERALASWRFRLGFIPRLALPRAGHRCPQRRARRRTRANRRPGRPADAPARSPALSVHGRPGPVRCPDTSPTPCPAKRTPDRPRAQPDCLRSSGRPACPACHKRKAGRRRGVRQVHGVVRADPHQLQPERHARIGSA
jgi:hypothetical protein